MTSTTPFPTERTVVLTGAASARGIGRAAADRLASEGWSIAILDINAEDAKAAAAQIGANRAVKALRVGADVSDEASVDRANTEIEGSLPPIVALANLAGISSPTTTRPWRAFTSAPGATSTRTTRPGIGAVMR